MDIRVDVRNLLINPDNPRQMSEFMEGKLIESLLVFPKMLEARPILVNEDNLVLGGNQRVTVLNKILIMDENEVEDYLFNQKKFRKAPDAEKQAIMAYWREWKENPQVPVRVVDNLTKEEEKELLVKDNLHYGEDDIEIMKKHFDRESIGDFLGGVAWNLYDYDDKMNYKELEIKVTSFPEKFKCGYVECQLTDEEFRMLVERLDAYLAENEGKSDGFLTHILMKQ